jgi:hypothetical protein
MDPKVFRVVGPQCEIADPSQQFPPGSLVTEPMGSPAITADRDHVVKLYKPDDFNEFTIRCVGKHMTISVNGVTTVAGHFPTMPDQGIIAWQIHGRNTPREVAFKDIALIDLSGTAESAGFQPLFNDHDLTGWRVDRGGADTWRVENGVLVGVGSGDWRKTTFLLSERDYADFNLRFEFQLPRNTDSGVIFRATPGEDHIELNLRSFNDPPGTHPKTGALHWSTSGRGVDYLPPDRPAALKLSGAWNEMVIDLRGGSLRISINDRDVLTTELGSLAKLPKALPGLARRSGRIGFQAHTGTVRFRNIRIKTL